MLRRWEISLALGMLVAVLLCSLSVFAGDCAQVRSQVVRLHVLANSDSEEDQALKLAVRDAVLAASADLFSASGSKEEIEALARADLPRIEQTARQAVHDAGYDYPVSAEIVNMYFETRTYDGTTLPAGRYDALRLSIGSGQGGNWWCVMFPPLCIPAAAGEEAQEVERHIAELGEPAQLVAKFAIVELIENLRESW